MTTMPRRRTQHHSPEQAPGYHDDHRGSPSESEDDTFDEREDDTDTYGDASRSRSTSRRPDFPSLDRVVDPVALPPLGGRGIVAADQRLYNRVRTALRHRQPRQTGALAAPLLAATAALVDIEAPQRRTRAGLRRRPNQGTTLGALRLQAGATAAASSAALAPTAPSAQGPQPGLVLEPGSAGIAPEVTRGRLTARRGRPGVGVASRRQPLGGFAPPAAAVSIESAPAALRQTGSLARQGSLGRGRRGRTPGTTETRVPSIPPAEVVEPLKTCLPCEDNCYACCLADSVDVFSFHSAWIAGLRQRAAAAAAFPIEDDDGATEEIATVANAPAARRGRSSGTGNLLRIAEFSSDIVVTHELQIVPLNKETLLLKVGHKDCFVFDFGCLVCWGCSPEELTIAREALKPFLRKALKPQDVEDDNIDLETSEVPLSSRDAPVFEKLALAAALAQSVRLASLEERIARTIMATRNIPQSMAVTGEVAMSNRHVTQMMGNLFVLRNQVNLETDILDTPDILWEYSAYEPLYEESRIYLDVDRRVTILNQRFEVLQDMFDFLEDELNDRHATWLEWVIIVLCAVESLIMLMKLCQKDAEDAEPSAAHHNATGFHLPNLSVVASSEVLPFETWNNLARMPVLGTSWYLLRHLARLPGRILALLPG